MPASIDSIPYAKIADIDFSKPKSTILAVKQGAHCNNVHEMLTDPAEIEATSDFPCSNGRSTVGSLNPNMVPIIENEATLFFNNTIKHNPAVLSLLLPSCDSYIQNGPDDLVPFLYKPENEELTYKELLDVGEDIVFLLQQLDGVVIMKTSPLNFISLKWRDDMPSLRHFV